MHNAAIYISLTFDIKLPSQTREIMLPSQWILLRGSPLGLDPCEPKDPRIAIAKGAQQQAGIVLSEQQSFKSIEITRKWQNTKQYRIVIVA